MFENIVSQAAAALLAAAILATVQGLYAKYKKVNDYTKVLIFYVLDTAIGIVTLVLGTTVATNRALVITFCACSFACFFATAFMFGSTIKALSATHGIIEDIARYGANNHNNKPD